MMRACPRNRADLVARARPRALTVAQLAVATFVPGIERFEDKAFGARLVVYPLMMLLVPAIWWVTVKRQATRTRSRRTSRSRW